MTFDPNPGRDYIWDSGIAQTFSESDLTLGLSKGAINNESIQLPSDINPQKINTVDPDGRSPNDLVVTQDEQTVFVQSDGTISRHDLPSGNQIWSVSMNEFFPVEDHFLQLGNDEEFLYYPEASGGHIYLLEIDTTNGNTTSTKVTNSASSNASSFTVGPNGDFAYIGAKFDIFQKVDISTGNVVWQVSPGQDYLRGIAIASDNSYGVLVGAYGFGIKFDLSDGSELDDVSVPEWGEKVTIGPNDRYAYIQTERQGVSSLTRYDSQAGFNDWTTDGPSDPRFTDIGVDSQNKFFYAFGRQYDATNGNEQSFIDFAGDREEGFDIPNVSTLYSAERGSDIGVYLVGPVNSTNVTLQWDVPKDVGEWDVASYQATEDNATVDVFLQYSSDGGNSYNTTNDGSPISKRYSMGADENISPTDDIRLSVDISRQTIDNNPRLDSAAISWKL
jgi:hypothetical protein